VKRSTFIWEHPQLFFPSPPSHLSSGPDLFSPLAVEFPGRLAVDYSSVAYVFSSAFLFLEIRADWRAQSSSGLGLPVWRAAAVGDLPEGSRCHSATHFLLLPSPRTLAYRCSPTREKEAAVLPVSRILLTACRAWAAWTHGQIWLEALFDAISRNLILTLTRIEFFLKYFSAKKPRLRPNKRKSCLKQLIKRYFLSQCVCDNTYSISWNKSSSLPLVFVSVGLVIPKTEYSTSFFILEIICPKLRPFKTFLPLKNQDQSVSFCCVDVHWPSLHVKR